MLRVPEVPQFTAERTYDTIRDPLKAMANSECRSVLCTTSVVVDYYSKFPFVKKLYNLTARAVVVVEWFVLPVSDNMKGAFGEIRARFFLARLVSREEILFLS